MRRQIGTSAAMLTPFSEDGAIDWARFGSHAKRLVASGMNVVTAFGTTGEGASLTRAERRRLYDEMDKSGIQPGQLVETVYGPSSTESGQDVAEALSAGAAGILLPPPFYFKDMSDEGIFRWYAELFETAGAGCRDIILYNIPGVTGVVVDADLIARLRTAFPGVVAGVKDSSGDWASTKSLLAEHKDLAILVGHEGHLAEAVRKGASGSIGGIANVAPKLIQRLVSGQSDPQIDAVIEQLVRMPVIPALKAILAQQTGDGGFARVRAPHLVLTDPAYLAVCTQLASELE